MNVDRLKFALAACRKAQSENGAEIRLLNLWAQLLEEIAQSLIEQHDPTAASPEWEALDDAVRDAGAT